ncbi:MAG: hypothetical protein IJH95_08155 [Mogibacterium sp.]|nr:hypothetical protein [Mogibacterium sp.]MBR0400766.1 hypothetical protein [Mogibacterium sp.]
MTVKKLKDILACLKLDKYAYLSINEIGRGPRRISIVGENDKYDVFTSNEKGNVTKEGENLSEKDACEMVIKIFQDEKYLYDYYESKGILEENGYYPIS